MHSSVMFLRTKIWSMHHFPFLNPACSCLSVSSRYVSILFSSTLQHTLLGIESSVIPLQLSQFPRSPFLCSLTIRPFAQSSWILFSSQMSLKRPCNVTVAVWMSAFSSSAWIQSMPATFPNFMDLIAFIISYWDGGSVFMSRSSSWVFPGMRLLALVYSVQPWSVQPNVMIVPFKLKCCCRFCL